MINFLSAVLPATGNYVLNVATPNSDGSGKWHKNYHAATLQDLEQQAIQLDQNPAQTVYYALGSFKDNIHPNKVGRTQAEAFMFKTLAFDVDPKDAKQNVVYATQRDMAKTALEACAKIGLPEPVFVSSGYGLHCYYPLTQEITKASWVRISSMLRDALTATGMVLDTSKVCDASMVLRPPGTHNKKQSGVKEVKLLSAITLFDPVALATVLKAFVKVVPTASTKTRKASAIMDAILESDFPPAESTLIETACAQIAGVVAVGGKVGYNLWRLTIGISKHCIDGRTVAHRWSSGDPRYTAKETDAKFDSWTKSATTCGSFERENSGPCSTCAHRGNITSPIQLGVPNTSTPVVTPAGISPKPPRGYTFHGDKIFRKLGDAAQHVSDYIIFPSRRYKDEETGKSMCLAECKLPKEGWRTYELPMDTLATRQDFQMWLVNQQLFVHNKTTVDETRRYMLTYLQELQQDTESDMMAGTFGWVDDECNAFVLGDRVITKNTVGEVRLSRSAADFTAALTPRGDSVKWSKATEMYDEPGMALFGLVFLMSIGSPLMVGSGLKSVLVNMYSKNTGTGKTSTGLYALSMYGNPAKLMMTVQDTDNSLFKSMGVYGNLPVYVDEITKIDRDKSGRLGQIAYFITQGREKRRMNKIGGFQESVEWQSIATSSSNDDMYALLSYQMSFEGESMRILQFKMPDTPLFKGAGSAFGYQLSMFLQKNYGMTGEKFINGILLMGGPHAVYAKARAKFDAKFGFAFSGAERFWQAAFIVAYATGSITNSLGITTIDVDACVEAGLVEVRRLRRELSDGRMDCFDILGQYLQEFSSMTTMLKKNTTMKNEHVVAPYPKEAVARVEAICDNKTPFLSGRLFLNQVHFNGWCHDRGIDRKGMMVDLSTNGVTVHNDRRISLMTGTDKTLPASRVFEIEMTHPRFVSIMSQTDLITPTLSLVTGDTNATGIS